MCCFERYADDIICHCRSEHEAAKLRKVLERRFLQCGLELHAEKTKVVYCKDTNRKRNHAIQVYPLPRLLFSAKEGEVVKRIVRAPFFFRQRALRR